jgi:hypothetical protein
LEQLPEFLFFLFAFVPDGIGIAIPRGRPKAVVPIADLPSHWDQTSRGKDRDRTNKQQVSIAKEGVLAVTNKYPHFRTAPRLNDCVQKRPYAAGELR